MTERDEFFSFEEALDRLRLKEEELKRLVSEGEIRAFREGETMRLRRADVDNLRRELMGGDVVDLDDAADEQLVLEDDLADPGMATEELTGADTLLEEELEELEELDEADLDEAGEDEGDEAAAERKRRGPEPVGEPVHPLAMLGIFVTTILLILTFPLIKNGNGQHSLIAKGISGMFGGEEEAAPTPAGAGASEEEAAPAGDAAPDAAAEAAEIFGGTDAAK